MAEWTTLLPPQKHLYQRFLVSEREKLDSDRCNCQTQDEPKDTGTAPVAVGLHMSWYVQKGLFGPKTYESLHKMCNLMAEINAYLQLSISILNIR